MVSKSRLARRTHSFTRIFQIIAATAGASSAAFACGGQTIGDGAGVADAGAGGDGPADIAEVGPPTNCGQFWAVDDASIDGNFLCDITSTCGFYGLMSASSTLVGCDILPTTADGGPDYDSGALRCYVLEGHGCSDGAFDAPNWGPITVQCVNPIGCGTGRRPAGLVRAAPARASHPAGAYFAEMARLEAASVHAFDRLARELTAHLAPQRLVDAAWESARDEVRHAASAGRLARRFGARPARARVGAIPKRSLAATRENVVEGCVRETVGALVNTWQATHARDADVRAALAEIARDETKHAALSWEIAAWAERRLKADERKSVKRARRDAMRALADEMARETSMAVRGPAGLPDAYTRRQMFALFSKAVGEDLNGSVETRPGPSSDCGCLPDRQARSRRLRGPAP